jgi:hypothetical protein
MRRCWFFLHIWCKRSFIDYNEHYDLACLDSLLDFEFDSDFELFMDSFRSTFLHMFHLLVGCLFGMVFEHFQDSFDLKDLVSSFIQLH